MLLLKHNVSMNDRKATEYDGNDLMVDGLSTTQITCAVTSIRQLLTKHRLGSFELIVEEDHKAWRTTTPLY